MEFDQEILKRAIEQNGKEQQTDKIVEECAELIVAIQKFKEPGGDVKQKWWNLIDELADVTIMVEQGKNMFDMDGLLQGRIDFKLERLAKRLKQEKK